MSDERKKKLFRRIVLIGIAVLLLLNVSISFDPFDVGGCISVAFDKLPMMLANRAVISVDGTQYEISDINLVREISKETVVAEKTDLCCESNGDRWIEVYCGNVLIRRMQWERNHDAIVVYNSDLLHWVLFSSTGDGLVYPSAELMTKMEAVVSGS